MQLFDTEMTVERYRLSVDPRGPLSALLSEYDTDAGQVWGWALSELTGHRTATLIVPEGVTPENEWFDPRHDETTLPDGVQWCDVMHEVRAVEVLTRLGYVTEATTPIIESSSGSYLGDSIVVTWVWVAKGFKVYPVTYSDYETRTLVMGSGYARRWFVGDAIEVPAGGYVSGAYGDFTSRMHAIGFTEDRNGEPTWEHVAEIEGFMACCIAAGCNECGRVWRARDGSWHFKADPESSDHQGEAYPDFDFDDCEDFDSTDNTVACPIAECEGRMGFGVSS